jgi:hypothetical protein
LIAAVFAGPVAESALEDLRGEARSRASTAHAGFRSLLLLDQSAYNQAVAALDPEGDPDMPSGKALAVAVINCIRHNRPVGATLRRLLEHPTTRLPQSIADPFRRALARDRELVERFVLSLALPRETINATPAVYRAALVEHCGEAARLAGAFERAADSLSVTGETQATAFFKAAAAFEAAYGALFALPAPDLARIRRFLTGESADPEPGEEAEQ